MFFNLSKKKVVISMNCAIRPCLVFSLNGRKKNIIPNKAKAFETEKQQSLS